MEAAIEKILSTNIDVNPEEVPDFREDESGNEGDPDSDVESSEEESSDEEATGSEEGSEEGDDDGSEDEDAEQDALDADLGPEDDSEDEADDVGQSEGEDSEEEEGGKKQQKAPGFLEGGKSDTFARAFARILDSSATAKPAVAGAPILAGSKSLAARKAEDEAEAKADKAAKKLRLEMRQRGHVVPKRRGEDPSADAREKALQKTATRGVVRLFNAVAKAQRRLRDDEGATGSRAKAAKLGKASFLAELKASRGSSEAGKEAVVPSARGASAAVAAGPPGGGSDSDEEGGAGWAVLQEGFTGLQGGSKMKDWDKNMSEDESDGGAGEIGGSSDEDE